jgi:hypothetical protein
VRWLASGRNSELGAAGGGGGGAAAWHRLQQRATQWRTQPCMPSISLTITCPLSHVPAVMPTRSDIVLSTKLFFGDGGEGPNDKGLSRKHIQVRRSAGQRWRVRRLYSCMPGVCAA